MPGALFLTKWMSARCIKSRYRIVNGNLRCHVIRVTDEIASLATMVAQCFVAPGLTYSETIFMKLNHEAARSRNA